MPRLPVGVAWMLGSNPSMTEGANALTLTLSPQAGRGDVPNVALRLTETVRHISFSPRRGEGGGSRMRGRPG